MREVRRLRIEHDGALFDFSPEAGSLWDRFYFALRKQREGMDARSNQLTARTDEQVLKLALLYAALSGEQMIDAESLAVAIKLGEWLQTTALRLFGNVGLDPFSRAEKSVLELVKKGRRIFRRDLQQTAYKRGVNAEMFGRLLKALEANGPVRPGSEKTLSSRDRPVVHYIGEQEQ